MWLDAFIFMVKEANQSGYWNNCQVVTTDSKMFVYAGKVIRFNYLFRKPSCKSRNQTIYGAES